jgi:hypothetical protein
VVQVRRRTKLLTAVVVALAFGLLQLALAHNGSAATESSCQQTTLETVATDAADYPPGATVHITGTGYNAGCDVEIDVSRPDGVVDAATVTTDPFGNFAYDYVLPGPPGVIGDYGLDVRGYADVVLASMTFSDGGVKIAAGDVSSDSGFAFGTQVAAVNQVIYARASSTISGRGYKLELFNPGGTSVYLGPWTRTTPRRLASRRSRRIRPPP